MKEIYVEIGKTYALRSQGGGAVQDAEGNVLKTLGAAQQEHMTAQEPVWFVPDDCRVTKVFNAALALLGQPSGGGSALPTGYTPIEFVENTSSQYIDTGVTGACLATFDYVAVTAATNNEARQWGERNANAANKGVTWGVRPSTGFNLYGCFNIVACEYYTRYSVEHYLYADSATACGLSVNGKKQSANVGAMVNADVPYLFFKQGAQERLYSATISVNSANKRKMIPIIDEDGEVCMYDEVTRLPFYNVGSGRFTAGLTIPQASVIGRKLPTKEGTLKICLPRGYEDNAAVNASLELAASKGWTTPITYHTPEAAASTYSRFVRNVIWCRAVADECGEYLNSNNEAFTIEYCSAIYGPRGNDPTDYGYTAFGSVEEAAEEWGLTPVMTIEEDLTETE